MPTVVVNDINMHYERSGAGAPLLFLHGLGSSGRDWELQVDHFEASYDTLVCDTRGHGQSDKPPGPYTVSQFATDVAGLIMALDLQPVHVVGLSMGGSIAFQLAVDHPSLLRSMVIVNSAPAVVPQSFSEHSQVWFRLALAHFLGVRQTGIFLSKRLFPHPDQVEIRELFVERWADNDPHAYRAAMRALIGWSVADKLETIMTPTLVIAAEHDYTSVSRKEEYTARLPNAKLVVFPNSHHGTPVDQPQEFNVVVERFLASLDGHPQSPSA